MYGVVWRYTDTDGNVHRLLNDPESLQYLETEQAAKAEGRQILKELAPENRMVLMPSAVVEVSDEMQSELNTCPRVELASLEDEDDPVVFVDVSETEYWSSQSWWHK